MKTGTRTAKIPSNMTSEEINNALKAESLNQAAIARDLKVSATAVSLVVHDKSGAKRIADAIGEAIHKDPKYIWPSRYWDGTPQRGPKKVVWQRDAAAV